MSANMCRLCKQHPAIESSHVIPGFVIRAIKSDSPTGFFRNPNLPNRRLQDGDKLPLLCADCEQRFGKAEHQFANNIFLPFHKTDQDHFSYGPYLHYFMTSLAWRTLILDLPGLESDVANRRSAVATLAAATLPSPNLYTWHKKGVTNVRKPSVVVGRVWADDYLRVLHVVLGPPLQKSLLPTLTVVWEFSGRRVSLPAPSLGGFNLGAVLPLLNPRLRQPPDGRTLVTWRMPAAAAAALARRPRLLLE